MIIEKLMEDNKRSRIISEMFKLLGWDDKPPSYLEEWQGRFDDGIDTAVSHMDSKTKEAFLEAVKKYPNF